MKVICNPIIYTKMLEERLRIMGDISFCTSVQFYLDKTKDNLLLFYVY